MKSHRNSFTLIELLVVMAVIAILSAITLGAAGSIQNKAARSRAAAEIAALGTALEAYKTDNGVYPDAPGLPKANTAYSASTYKIGATNLYFALSGGQKDFLHTVTGSGPVYMTFKKNMLDTTVSCGVQDPFGYYYGYSGTTNAIMNVGFYDLWSTSGKTSIDNASNTTNVWVNNWSSQ